VGRDDPGGRQGLTYSLQNLKARRIGEIDFDQNVSGFFLHGKLQSLVSSAGIEDAIINQHILQPCAHG
jgi:hypothetical protein